VLLTNDVFNVNNRFYIWLMGKAEAGSAGEQLARNSPFDWNGQQGWSFMLQPFFDVFQESMPLKTHF
jgi:hypothetical protein